MGKKMRSYEVDLPVTFLKEGKKFIAYTPALDLSTCGDDFDQAKKRFEEIVRIFLEELFKMGTLESVLLECGWKKVSRPKLHWVPPVIISRTEESFKVPCPA
ncbi:hypothetical protein KAX00_00820 [bacterium]|nr:hypothetical protein [bacterium]